MNIEDLEILKELSEQTYFGDLPFLYYADLIGKLLTAYEKEKEKNKKLENELKGITKKYMEAESVKFWYNYIHKDKIKAKIEEVDIQLQKLKDGLTGRKTNFVNKNMLFAQKKVLQSLLEKE